VRAILYADGAARGNPGPAGAGAVLMDADGHVLAELTKSLGHATNNVAEYTALIIGLEEAKRRGVDDIDVRMDSKLVVEQMNGRWKIKHPNMKPLALRAGELWASFPRRSIVHVRREENGIADALSNKAIDDTLTTRAIDDAT
jgi:probable phosphoglycerate mutase